MVGRKVVPMAKPQQGGVRDEAARQKRMAEGQALVNEWARQGRLPDGITAENWFQNRLCLLFQAGNCKFGGAQAMVEEGIGGDGFCGSPVSHEPRLKTQAGGGGGRRAVVALPGAKRASNKIAAELQAREEQEEKAAIGRQQAWALKKCGKYLSSHKVADRYKGGEFGGRAEG